jgi:hypothetical protein
MPSICCCAAARTRLVGEDHAPGVGAEDHRYLVVVKDAPHVLDVAAAQPDEVGEVVTERVLDLRRVHRGIPRSARGARR